MSMTDPAAPEETSAPDGQSEPIEPVAEMPDAQGGAAPKIIVEHEQQVILQRSVRYGRVIVGAVVVGAAIASLLSLVFPLAENAEYTMAQIVGFMALIGGAIGLGLGAILALILARSARRRQGSGVAIQTDVR